MENREGKQVDIEMDPPILIMQSIQIEKMGEIQGLTLDSEDCEAFTMRQHHFNDLNLRYLVFLRVLTPSLRKITRI